jgi:hypothetical protein
MKLRAGVAEMCILRHAKGFHTSWKLQEGSVAFGVMTLFLHKERCVLLTGGRDSSALKINLFHTAQPVSSDRVLSVLLLHLA